MLSRQAFQRLISIYEKLAKDNPLLRQLNAVVEYGQVMPNIPQMGRFFSSVVAPFKIATQDSPFRRGGIAGS